MLVSNKHFISRIRFCLGLLVVLTLGLALWASDSDAKTIYACAQKHGNTNHRAKAALRLVRKSVPCLPGERRLSWVAGSGGPTTSAATEAGARGATGDAGAPGAAGSQGTPGAVGVAGSQGEADIAGSAGAAGASGAEGLQGPIGPEGPAGPMGPEGPQGPFGPIGLEGPEGPIGATGPEGLEGPVGPTGPEGPMGVPGLDGEVGLAGPLGPQGPIGPEGPAGDVGPQGPAGEQGPIGETGPEGPAGVGGIGAVLVITAEGGEGEFADARCPKQAPLAIGGGGSADKGGLLEISAPITDHELSGDGQQPTGWRVRSNSSDYTAYAICTGAAPESTADPEKEAAEEKEAGEVKLPAGETEAAPKK